MPPNFMKLGGAIAAIRLAGAVWNMLLPQFVSDSDIGHFMCEIWPYNEWNLMQVSQLTIFW